MIDKINTILDKKDKKALFYIFLFSILISIIETAGVSLIMPFMSVAGDFNLIHSNEYYSFFYNFFSIGSEIEFVIVFETLEVLYALQ